MDRQYIIDSLRFWTTFPDETKKGEEKRAWKAELRTTIDRMDDETCRSYAEVVRRQYAEQEATRASVASRGSALLLFVGVISTGATVVAASLETSAPVVLGLALVFGACLLYACLAVAFLAVRAQEVATWEVPAIYPKDSPDARTLAVSDAVELAVAYEQNKSGLRHIVAYLADAQRWARRAIILVVILAVLSVAATATKPAGSAAGATTTPAPAAAATQTPAASSPAP